MSFSDKHIFFDLDRTLWDFDENSKAIITKTSICNSKKSNLINAQQIKISESSKNFFILDN